VCALSRYCRVCFDFAAIAIGLFLRDMTNRRQWLCISTLYGSLGFRAESK
jgi:hypothetical protein